jgi:hypothetical protein
MTQPADVVLSSYFRTHHELGSTTDSSLPKQSLEYCDGALDLNTNRR